MNDWIINRYGSRRGVVRTWWHRLCGLAGRYSTYRDVDWDSVGRPMLVCSTPAPGRSQGFFCNQRLHRIVLARQLGIHRLYFDTSASMPPYFDFQF